MTKKIIPLLLAACCLAGMPLAADISAGSRISAHISTSSEAQPGPRLPQKAGRAANLPANSPEAQPIPQPIRRFLQLPGMEGASFSLLVKALENGETIYSYDSRRELTPASVLKTVTTATALELLGPDYRFPTTLEYDGEITGGVLQGNLYIKGSGDPTLGSAHLAAGNRDAASAEYDFTAKWLAAVREAGIREIRGAVVADESIFDTEGISGKTVYEDLGSYYGAGSYGLSVFDNLYRLYVETGAPGSRPVVRKTVPDLPTLRFHNYLQTQTSATDSSFILGAPFATDRYLYGTVPANRKSYTLKGDIPDPALFLAAYFTGKLQANGLSVANAPGCYRIWKEEGKWNPKPRQTLLTTYSPPLEEIVKITNHVSHNLYADALLKTLGLTYPAGHEETLSSFERGVRVVRAYWKEKGLDVSSLCMYDGSGLALADKLTTHFLAELFTYMARQSPEAPRFIASLPLAGQEGSVVNFLRGSDLQGKTRLKSGSMSRVKGYAGYIEKGGKSYAVVLFVNNYGLEGRQMNKAIENLLLTLFRPL